MGVWRLGSARKLPKGSEFQSNGDDTRKPIYTLTRAMTMRDKETRAETEL